MKKLLAAALMLVMLPVNALLTTWAAQKHWTWFVERELGAGPSAAAWFGIFAIVNICLAAMSISIAQASRDPEAAPVDFYATGVVRSAVVAITVPLGTLMSYLVGNLLGWI